ncbi:hypothetical protein O3M35_002676 [Rhynocoris fuscipes]|uniref:Uncharacterized protein n=1 Tax=Rhynocoris fuscipes TaxID=488301 RepID=A0AAW1CM78_9HEMI
MFTFILLLFAIIIRAYSLDPNIDIDELIDGALIEAGKFLKNNETGIIPVPHIKLNWYNNWKLFKILTSIECNDGHLYDIINITRNGKTRLTRNETTATVVLYMFMQSISADFKRCSIEAERISLFNNPVRTSVHKVSAEVTLYFDISGDCRLNKLNFDIDSISLHNSMGKHYIDRIKSIFIKWVIKRVKNSMINSLSQSLVKIIKIPSPLCTLSSQFLLS